MSKCHRSVNKLVGGSRDLLYEAYDKGYEQGKTDYERHPGHWTMKNGTRYGVYECSECFVRNFVPTMFCPDCGAPMDKVIKKAVVSK